MLTVAVLPGDGIGDEIMSGPLRILELLEAEGIARPVGPLPIGARAHVTLGERLPAATRAACDAADAILLGAVGEHPGISMEEFPRPELALIELRDRYDLRVSIREVLLPDGRISVVVRNLRGGNYGGADLRTESDGTVPATDTLVLTTERIEELALIACEQARLHPGRRFISVDKANLLATGRLWRMVARRVIAAQGLEAEHLHVDRAAYELASPGCDIPAVILTEGLFGDILSDLLTGVAGSPALCGSASVRPGAPDGLGPVGLFEPAHGSAPRRAGRDQANPTGTFLALAMLLESFPTGRAAAERVRRALDTARADGPLTYDLAVPDGPVASASAFSARVVAAYAAET
jgi:isocitrate/isopropylmalate dehydrogenase